MIAHLSRPKNTERQSHPLYLGPTIGAYADFSARREGYA